MSSRRTVQRVWRAHPQAARFLRVMAFTVPILAGYVVASLTAAMVGRPGLDAGLGVWLPIIASALVGTLLLKYMTRRLPRRAALLELQLEFPERTPVRIDILKRAEDSENLRKIATQASVTGSHDFQEAAEVSLAIVNSHSRRVQPHKSHSERVRAYTDLIAHALRVAPSDRDRLRWASLLHDIGKFALPASVINKKHRVTINEREVQQSHAVRGALLISPLLDWVGGWGDAVAFHHEHWDGTGYPEGLEDEEIPLGARIVAVADGYDLMTTGRWQGQRRMTHAAARSEIEKRAGSTFDPAVVRAFMNIKERRLRAVGGLFGVLPWLAPLRSLNTTFVIVIASLALTGIAGVAGAFLPAPDLSVVNPARLIDSMLQAIGLGQEPEADPTTTTVPETTTTQLVTTTTTTIPETTTTSTTASPTTTRVTAPPTTTTTAPPTTTSTTTTTAPTTTTTDTTAPTTTTSGP